MPHLKRRSSHTLKFLVTTPCFIEELRYVHAKCVKATVRLFACVFLVKCTRCSLQAWANHHVLPFSLLLSVATYTNQVYNLTPFLHYHPGGIPEIMKGAGKDCTALYDKYHPWVNFESLVGVSRWSFEEVRRTQPCGTCVNVRTPVCLALLLSTVIVGTHETRILQPGKRNKKGYTDYCQSGAMSPWAVVCFNISASALMRLSGGVRGKDEGGRSAFTPCFHVCQASVPLDHALYVSSSNPFGT